VFDAADGQQTAFRRAVTIRDGLLGDLSADHVVMTAGEAARLGRELWSLEFDAVRLDTEKDDTFRVETADGRRYVLKVANPAEDSAEIDFECQVMEYAGARGVRVPRLVPDVEGRLLVPVRDEAGQERLARLMTFVEGVPLDSTGSSEHERERVGETLAALRHALADFRHHADGRRYAWDLTHLPELGGPLLDMVAGGEHGMLLRTAFERYMTEAAPHVPRLRRQVLHNDFSKSNIIVDHDDPAFVTGVIDFGDTVRTAIAIDVSTALLNQLPRDVADREVDDLFAEGRDLLRGYLRHADLTAEELAVLPHLVMGRVVARALITLYRAAAIPRNRDYILRNTEQGWAQLAWFMARSPAVISRSFL
jgi:Ser/Thr protein kinase RdoA (MazF antagonist)